MTKKDFEIIASILKNFNEVYNNDNHHQLIEFIWWHLKAINPKFKINLFIKACNN